MTTGLETQPQAAQPQSSPWCGSPPAPHAPESTAWPPAFNYGPNAACVTRGAAHLNAR